MLDEQYVYASFVDLFMQVVKTFSHIRSHLETFPNVDILPFYDLKSSVLQGSEKLSNKSRSIYLQNLKSA